MVKDYVIKKMGTHMAIDLLPFFASDKVEQTNALNCSFNDCSIAGIPLDKTYADNRVIKRVTLETSPVSKASVIGPRIRRAQSRKTPAYLKVLE